MTNKTIRGDVSDYAAKLLSSANLTTLRKTDGGIHLVTVSKPFHRLIAKVDGYAASSAVSYKLSLIQHYVTVKGGIHMVTVSNAFHRLIAKVGGYAASNTVSYELSLIQHYVTVKGGAKVAVHAVCKFLTTNPFR